MNRYWWAGAAWQILALVAFVLADDGWRWMYGVLVVVFALDYAITARLAYWQRRYIEAIRTQQGDNT